MKKALLILGATVALLIPVSAYASTARSRTEAKTWGPFRIEAEDLTKEQKDDLEESFDEMIEVRRSSINKMIENGMLTKEQGEEALKNLDDMVEYHEENGYVGGMGMMNGYGMGINDEYEYGYGCGPGRGMMSGYGRGMRNRY